MQNILNPKSALWTAAFRPFFLAAGLHSAFAVSFWMLILFSVQRSPFLLNGIQVHSYEMVFGFARAAILGFLFTAAQNWTKSALLNRNSLFFLSALWLIGRFGFLYEPLTYLAITSDLYCDILVLFYLAPPLWKKGQEHNRIIVISYTLFFISHVCVIFSYLEIFPSAWGLHFVHLSIFLVLQFVVIIGGRILPFFTSVAVPKANPKKIPLLERIVQYTWFLFLLLEVLVYWLPVLHIPAGLFCLGLAIVHFFRFFLLEPWRSIRVPILWVLHSGYFWLVVGLTAYGLSHLGLFETSPAFHLFTTGAIGVFVFGMITRVSLGHTGRPIRASRPIILAYLLINLAVISRSFLPLFGKNIAAYAISSSCWVSAFLIFLLEYYGILVNPRLEPGGMSRR